MTPKAFIFDMDGVIIHSNPYHKIALHQFCEKYGYHLTEEELRARIYGRTNQQWITNLFGRALTLEELHAYAEEKESLFRALMERDIKPLAGLHTFLMQSRHHGFKTAIGTSAPRSNVDFVMQHTQLGEFFPIILDDSFVTHGKPHPEIYLKCAAALGYKPEDCVVFEDSLSGVEAGQAAGAKVVGVATTHTADELKHTDWVITDFTNVNPIALVNQLFLA